MRSSVSPEPEKTALERFAKWFSSLPFEKQWDYVMRLLSSRVFIYGSFVAAAPFLPGERDFSLEELQRALVSVSESRVVLGTVWHSFAETSKKRFVSRSIKLRDAFTARWIAFLFAVVTLFENSLMLEMQRLCEKGSSSGASA